MFTNPFRQLTPADIAERQRTEAERAALEHEASAEHHAALASMYRTRVARLGSVLINHPSTKGVFS